MLSIDPVTLPEDGQLFFNLVSTYLAPEELARVQRAFDLAKHEHGDERRRSGELFFTHPLTVAYYLAKYRLDDAALVAALLHDVAEDTRVEVADITRLFGSDIGHLVDGVTKLDHFGNQNGLPATAEQKQNATLHKLFEAMTGDVRVVLVKLFDRLHNLRTIDSMPYEKQRKKAEETLAIYAPLANRLGMWDLKNELQSLAIRVLHRQLFQVIDQQIEQLTLEQQPLYAAVSSEVAATLTRAGLSFHDIERQPNDPYTEFIQFEQQQGYSLDTRNFRVDKTLRVVVLLDDMPSCYVALGLTHQLWRPVKYSFDDYIAAPRDNLYRALHTTVMHSSGHHVKIRFRTKTMAIMSSVGILANWAYKDTPLWREGVSERVDALYHNISEHMTLEPQNLALGVQGVVEDVFSNQILVYTPQGDARELPQGATPIDFAYAIHTAVGHQCRMAYVNGIMTPLNRALNDGERVYIIKRARPKPERNWLDEDLGFIKTSRARSRVRRWFRRMHPNVAIAEGEQILAKELDLLGLPDYPHQWLAEMFGYDTPDFLYYALGRAELLTPTLANKLLEAHWDQGPRQQVGSIVESAQGERFVINNAGNRSLRLCHVCRPRPGDPIVGYVRSTTRVTVHKIGCYSLPPDPLSSKMLKLEWGSGDAREVRLMKIEIDGYDRAGLMFEVLELIQSEAINMTAVNAHGGGDHANIHLEVMVNSPRQLVRILHRTLALVNVYAVRLLHAHPVSLQSIRLPAADLELPRPS